jgi:hypothetical protein
MDIRSRQTKNSPRVVFEAGPTPEERLQRLADAFDTEPERVEWPVMDPIAADHYRRTMVPLATPAVAPAQDSRKRFGWLKNLGLFLAIVAVTTAAGGALLTALDRPPTHQDVPFGATAGTGSVPAASPAAASRSDPLAKSTKLQSAGTTARVDDSKPQLDAPAPDRAVTAPQLPDSARSVLPTLVDQGVDNPLPPPASATITPIATPTAPPASTHASPIPQRRHQHGPLHRGTNSVGAALQSGWLAGGGG